MLRKIIGVVLGIFAIYMGIKQGYAMIMGDTEMLQLFGGWGIKKSIVKFLGILTLSSAIFIIFPRTFTWGNLLMGATILFILIMQILHNNWKGAAVELPFLLVNVILLFVDHPMNKKIKLE